MKTIKIVPESCPADKEQRQTTLVLAVEKLMGEYLAEEDDRIAVGLSILGTVIANTNPLLRGNLYNVIGKQLLVALRATQYDEQQGACGSPS